MLVLDYLSSGLLVACLLASAGALFQRQTPPFFRMFPIYFLVSLVTQQVGSYMAVRGIHNTVLYNCYSALEFGFYFFVLYNIIHNPKLKKTLVYLAIFYPVLSMINIFFFQGESVFHTLTYVIGVLMIAIFCILYFVELFRLDHAVDLMTEPSFWICTAALFSYVCGFPFWGMVNLMSASFNIVKALTILAVINILTYIIFLIAFLCRIRIRKSIS